MVPGFIVLVYRGQLWRLIFICHSRGTVFLSALKTFRVAFLLHYSAVLVNSSKVWIVNSLNSIRGAKPPTRRITIFQFYLVFEKILGVSALKSDKQERASEIFGH